MNKCTIHSVLSTLLLLGFLLGCTKEDTSKCWSGVTLSISYTGSAGKDALPELIEEISAYVFDSVGNHVKTVTELTSDLVAANYKMPISLEADQRYKVIVLGVDDEDYTDTILTRSSVSGASAPLVRDIDDFRVLLKHQRDNISSKDLGGFFIAEEQDVEVKRYNNLEYPANLTKNNKRIRFTIEGASSIVRPIVKSKNSIYNKNNDVLDMAYEVIYKPCSEDLVNDMYITTTLRIVEGIAMPLTMESEESENTVEYDLVDLIQSNPKYNTQESLDIEDFFEVEFTYSEDAVISIKVNQWEVINVIPKP